MEETQITGSEIPRRRFLHGALVAAGLPPLCCTTQPLSPACIGLGDAKITVDLARIPDLRRSGASYRIVDEGRKINLILIHAGRGRYVAMDRSCTHAGAQCTYDPKRQTVQCTSLNHAEYDLHGKLLHGRTHGDLRTYPVRVTGSKLEIVWRSDA